jgi:hypothetical protein
MRTRVHKRFRVRLAKTHRRNKRTRGKRLRRQTKYTKTKHTKRRQGGLSPPVFNNSSVFNSSVSDDNNVRYIDHSNSTANVSSNQRGKWKPGHYINKGVDYIKSLSGQSSLYSANPTYNATATNAMGNVTAVLTNKRFGNESKPVRVTNLYLTMAKQMNQYVATLNKLDSINDSISDVFDLFSNTSQNSTSASDAVSSDLIKNFIYLINTYRQSSSTTVMQQYLTYVKAANEHQQQHSINDDDDIDNIDANQGLNAYMSGIVRNATAQKRIINPSEQLKRNYADWKKQYVHNVYHPPKKLLDICTRIQHSTNSELNTNSDLNTNSNRHTLILPTKDANRLNNIISTLNRLVTISKDEHNKVYKYIKHISDGGQSIMTELNETRFNHTYERLINESEQFGTEYNDITTLEQLENALGIGFIDAKPVAQPNVVEEPKPPPPYNDTLPPFNNSPFNTPPVVKVKTGSEYKIGFHRKTFQNWRNEQITNSDEHKQVSERYEPYVPLFVALDTYWKQLISTSKLISTPNYMLPYAVTVSELNYSGSFDMVNLLTLSETAFDNGNYDLAKSYTPPQEIKALLPSITPTPVLPTPKKYYGPFVTTTYDNKQYIIMHQLFDSTNDYTFNDPVYNNAFKVFKNLQSNVKTVSIPLNTDVTEHSTILAKLPRIDDDSISGNYNLNGLVVNYTTSYNNIYVVLRYDQPNNKYYLHFDVAMSSFTNNNVLHKFCKNHQNICDQRNSGSNIELTPALATKLGDELNDLPVVVSDIFNRVK